MKKLGKKQIAAVNNNKKLRGENAELKEQNQVLTAKYEGLKKQTNNTIHLKLENSKLEKKMGALESTLAKIMEFLEKLGLKRQLELFLNPTERQRESKSNQQEL